MAAFPIFRETTLPKKRIFTSTLPFIPTCFPRAVKISSISDSVECHTQQVTHIPTTSSSALLGLQQYYYIVWSLREPRFVLVCVRGVASARPRRASKRLDCRLWKRDLFHQHNRKGKIAMIKTSRYKGLVFGFVFGT